MGRWKLPWTGRLGLPAASRNSEVDAVTCDRRTIPPLLKDWAEAGRPHAGVIFVDEKTISQADIGGLVQSLGMLLKEARDWDWTDRVCFLQR
jgi:hypothetical protein